MAGKILVIDSVMPNRIILKVKLSGAGYDVQLAASAREGVETALQTLPDIIIMDMDLPDLPPEIVMDQLQEAPQLGAAIVLMTSTRDDEATRMRAFRAGCDEFFARPFSDTSLLARLRSFFREFSYLQELSERNSAPFIQMMDKPAFEEKLTQFMQSSNVLVVGPQEAAMRFKRKLPAALRDRVFMQSPTQILTDNDKIPDYVGIVAIISDPTEPNAALHMISKLRARAQTRDAKFILEFSEAARSDDYELACDFGADAIITASAPSEEVALRLTSLIKRKSLADGLRADIRTGLMLSMIDPLTNIANRRHMAMGLYNFVSQARQTGSPVAVILCDLDRFKTVNDSFGHAVGDTVLRTIAQRLSNALREGDLIARIGGDEFLVALPNTDLEGAQSVAERLINAACGTPVEISESQHLLQTISLGVSIADPRNASPIDQYINDLTAIADHAMLLSKAQGRNKMSVGRTAA